jgi:hypothetical protein
MRPLRFFGIPALLLVLGSAPAFCTTILSFTKGAASGGVIDTSKLNQGDPSTLTNRGFENVGLGSLTISGATDITFNGNFTITGGLLNETANDGFTFGITSVTCVSGGCTAAAATSLSAIGTWFTFSTGALSDSDPTSSLSVGLNNPTSIADASLRNALGFGSAPVSQSITGTFISSGISNPYTLTSNTMQLSITATPEPASMLLAGVGLLGLGLISRRKNLRRAQ